MPSRSIEISDDSYNKLIALKSKDESWDEFLVRLTKAVKLIHPSKSEWKDAYKNAFKDHKDVFQKLAEWSLLKIPNLELVLDLHMESINEFGGESGILNKDGLKGFVDSIYQAVLFGNKTTTQTAAYIFVRLIQNHFFVDGNKRVGLGTLLSFLSINNCKFIGSPDLYELTMYVASSDIDVLDKVEKQFETLIDCISWYGLIDYVLNNLIE